MHSDTIAAWIYWNPSIEAFRIPYFDHPVAWYGVLFATGIVIAYFLVLHILQKIFTEDPAYAPQAKELAFHYTDRLSWFVILGTIIGARLGHVFFYEWEYYFAEPMRILKIWEGGLASHGGTLGILASLWLFLKVYSKELPQLTYLNLTDILTIPCAFAGFCIRIGNFINQEIVGTETTVPWAIIFGTPLQHTPGLPRHPVQLYEAATYLTIFFLFYLLWNRYGFVAKGFFTGLFLTLVFGMRFVLEYFKADLGGISPIPYLYTGQLLSIPFILLGLALLTYSMRRSYP